MEMNNKSQKHYALFSLTPKRMKARIIAAQKEDEPKTEIMEMREVNTLGDGYVRK